MIEKHLFTKIVKFTGKENENISGLNFKGFKEALFRTIVKAKNMLNEIIDNKKGQYSERVRKNQLNE